MLSSLILSSRCTISILRFFPCCTLLVFRYFHDALFSFCTLLMLQFFSCCTFSVLYSLRVSLFLSLFMFSSCCVLLMHCSFFYFLYLLCVSLFHFFVSHSWFTFSCCTLFLRTFLMLNSFYVALFPYCILSCFAISILHFLRLALFSCCTFFILHSFQVALFSCSSFSVLHYFHAAFFNTLFMLHFLHVALFSSCNVMREFFRTGFLWKTSERLSLFHVLCKTCNLEILLIYLLPSSPIC